MIAKSLSERGIRLTPALRLTVAGGEVELTPEHAFGLAQDLIRRGARKIVNEEAARPTSARRTAR
jgi:hypothetical protein